MATSPPIPGGAGSPAPPSGISPTAPANVTTFSLKDVPPPSIVYIQRDDKLVLQAATSVGSELVTFNVRLLLTDGRIQALQYQVVPAANQTTVSLTVDLAEGYIISVSAQASNAFARGFTYARVFLNRGAFGSGQPGQVLFADYVTATLNVSWPNGRILQSTESAGGITQVAVGNPAAGASWSQAISTGERWRIQSVCATFVTSAAVANRVPSLLVNIGGATMLKLPVTAVIPASTTAIVTWAPGILSSTADPSLYMGGLPTDLVLEQNSVIATNVLAIQAADQWSNIRICVEQWLMNV